MLSMDMFGGGMMGGAPAEAPKPPPSIEAAMAAGFGPPSPTGAASLAPSASAAVDASDDFGDFGGGGGGGGSAPPAGVVVAPSDDFGDFGAPPSLGAMSGGSMSVSALPIPAAMPAGDDDFGGFGDGFGGFDAPPAPSVAAAVTTPSVMPAAGGDAFGGFDDDDDSFSQFEATKPPGGGVSSLPPPGATTLPLPAISSSPAPFLSPPGSAPIFSSGVAYEGGLEGLVPSLISQERFGEALACKQHIDAVANMSVQQAAYEKAKEEDDLEEALRLKKIVLPKMKEAIVPEHVVQGWKAPPSGHRTCAAMRQQAEQILGPSEAAPFVRVCCSADLGALAVANLEEAAAKHDLASATLMLLMDLPADAQARHLASLNELLGALTTQLRQAASALASKGADVDEATLGSPKVSELLKAILALRKVGCRLAEAREWYASVFAAAASAPIAGKAGVGSAAKARSEIQQLVNASHAAVGKEAPIEPLEDMAKYWSSLLPMGKRCSLSLLPLQSSSGDAALAELPPTVEWNGKRFHAPCANLWANCVRNAPP